MVNTTNKNKSNDNTSSYVETVDKHRARAVLYSDYEYKMRDIDNNQFITLLEYASTDTIRRTYRPSTEYPNGRQYSNGLATLSGDIRAYLCANDFVDLDIKRCFPSIIVNLCRQKNYSGDLAPIVNYIETADPDPALKKRVNACIFGSRERFNTELKSALTDAVDFLYECIESGELGVTGSTKVKSITALLQSEERKIIDKTVEVLNRRSIEIQALVYDGIIVHKSFKSTDLAEVNKSISPYVMVIKPWRPVEINPSACLEAFDWKCETNISNLNQSSIFNSMQHLHAVIGPIILRSLRVDSKGYILKLPDNRAEYVSKLPEALKSIEYEVGDKVVTFSALLKKYMPVIAVKGMRLYDRRPGYFSSWQGYAFNQVETVDMDKVKVFKDFIEKCIADDKPEVADYIIKWLAFIIQNPGEKTEVALIFSGFPGTGKSTLLNFLYEKIFGLPVTYKDSGLGGLTDRFNSSTEGRVLGLLEELKSSGTSDWKADLDIIKDIITGKMINIEAKYQDKRCVQNGINIIGFTNYSNTIPFISGNERRYFLHEISANYRESHSYFSDLNRRLDDETADHVGTWLLNIPVKKSDVISFPDTEQNQEQTFRWLQCIEKVLYIAWVQNGCTDYRIGVEDVERIGREYRITGIEKLKGKIGYDLKRYLGARDTSTRKYLLANCKGFMIKEPIVALTRDYITDMETECLF